MTLITTLLVLGLISMIIKTVMSIIRFCLGLLPFVFIYILVKKYILQNR